MVRVNFSLFILSFILSCNPREDIGIVDRINMNSIDSIVIQSNLCNKYFLLSKNEGDTIFSRMRKMRVSNPYVFTPVLKLIVYRNNFNDTILTNGNATKPFKGEYFFCDSNIFKNLIPKECYDELASGD